MDKDDVKASREGLLRKYNDQDGEHIPLRESLDDDTFLNFTDAQDDVFLGDNPIDGRPSRKDISYRARATITGIRRCVARRSGCLIICLAVLILFWSGLAGGGYWAYKHPPPSGQSPPWYPSPLGGDDDAWAESYSKATALVEKMSLVEKVNITTGTGWQMGLAVGQTGSALRVGFPSLALQDGPLGIRFNHNATAFPAGVTVGATWNKDLMYKRGKAHGHEARLLGINTLLGPCVGPLGRMPAGGRNWEGFGADPYLQGVAAAETIKGIQSEGVMATIKHFVGNEQEHFRQSFEWTLPNAMSSNIDDRTLHELYLWPFADAVKAGVASVMCSYQMVNNSYSCQNSKLLNGILKDELGFQGFVQSDWLAQRSGVASALAGLDMTMPGDGLRWQDGDSLWGSKLSLAVLNGSLQTQRFNDMATRVVAAWYQLGQDDESMFNGKGPSFSSWTYDKKGLMYPGSPDDDDIKVVNQFVNVRGEGEEAHSKIANDVAVEGIVLLKNEDNILPLNRKGWSDDKDHELKFKVGIFGEDSSSGDGPNACRDQACNQGTLGSGWGSGAVDFPYLVPPNDAIEKEFDEESVYVTKFPTNNPPMAKAPDILKSQDLCLVFASSNAGEGFVAVGNIKGDRNDLKLQNGGELLVKQVAEGCGAGAGQGNTVVVIHAVGPVVMEDWLHIPGVKAVLLANLPGQESGNALAEILFGDTNPSGKLPYTIGKSLDNYGPGAKILYYPNGLIPQQNFSEGLYIDYRYFDRYEIEPRFEFGFGLSYTTFNYSNMVVEQLKDKSPLPDARSPPRPQQPDHTGEIPDPQTALAPAGFRMLSKYIYPYISSVKDVKKGIYPYPEGFRERKPSSEAGGGPGGNPSLYQVHAKVTVDIKNTGDRDGKEVAQLYVSYPGSRINGTTFADVSDIATDVDFPVRVLRGFEKVFIPKGETRTVEFELTRRDLSFWDIVDQNWKMDTGGSFVLQVGASSRDLRLKKVF